MKTALFLIATVLFPFPCCLAQEDGELPANGGPVGIFASRAEYEQFMIGVKQAAWGERGGPELQAMIPMLNDIVLNRPVDLSIQKPGGDASLLGLLADPNVRADLEIVDDQYHELQRLNAEIQERTGRELRALDFGNQKDLVERIHAIRERATSDVNALLLPHQLERLKQLRLQSRLRQRSLVDLLTNDPLRSELEITDQQAEDLREEAKQIEEDLAKEIARLRSEARDRLLSRLNPSQKSRVENMIGDAFQFSAPQKPAANPKAGTGK